MRIPDLWQEGKSFLGKNWLIIATLFTVFGAYGLGYITALETLKMPLYLEKYTNRENVTVTDTVGATKHIVASKSGTKYYFIWCNGVSRIKAENKVFFSSILEAEKNGYTKARNCIGF